jgi:N-acetylneuraminate synthase
MAISSETENVFIVAEAGVNHNGDIKLAMKLIDAAAEAGADAVKFQTWVTGEVLVKDAPKAEYQKVNDGESSQYEMALRLELSFGDFRRLRDYSVSRGIMFMSTPDDIPSLNFLADDLNVKIIKVGSGEVTNIPFLEAIGRKQKKVILSTGMSSMDEVKRAYNTLLDNGAAEVTVLHCTSNYPAAFDSVNLRAMLAMRDVLGCRVGYSDHTPGTEVSVAAVALGAQVIEKHFTLDRTMPGPDHAASVEPLELASLVRQIRNVENALAGTGIKAMHDSERETRMVVTRGIYARGHIEAGTVIQIDHLAFKRPVKGMPAEDYGQLIGRRLIKSLDNDDPFMPGDVE